MKCPIDQTEMEEGQLPAGIAWTPRKSSFSIMGQNHSMTPWRCPKCGKVEWVTEPDKENN